MSSCGAGKMGKGVETTPATAAAAVLPLPLPLPPLGCCRYMPLPLPLTLPLRRLAAAAAAAAKPGRLCVVCVRVPDARKQTVEADAGSCCWLLHPASIQAPRPSFHILTSCVA